jgi:catechol 2,3-dioxygenase-like lactoylglutathione lyase family enzyme
MDLKNGSAALFVKNIEVSKHFYKDILGLSIELDFGKNVIFKNGFAIWEIQDQHIIPANLGLDKISDTSVNRFELYFETENLSGVFSTLKANEIMFLHGIHEETWGQRTIRVFDPDNHLVEIGESMKQFVGRFFNEGLTVDDISKRTGVPVEEVRRLITADNPQQPQNSSL